MSGVSAIVPSLRGGPHLPELVVGLAQTGAEVLVADNGMPDQQAAAAAAAGARIVQMGRNAGFGAAVNAAARLAAGEALLVLNDDEVLQDGFVEAMMEGLEEAAMVAGVLLKGEAPELVETAGIVIDRHLGVYDHLQDLPVARLTPALPPPLGPCGGAAAFRRAAFERAGGFDPGFFAYFEDVDLAIRLRHAGERCVLATGARAVHAGSATLGYDSLEKARIVGESRGRLVRKYGLLRTPASAVWVLATETATAAALARRHRSADPARARVAGFRACDERAPRPPADAAVVGLLDGQRRRWARSKRVTA